MFRKQLQGSVVGFFVLGLIFSLVSCAANPVTGQPQLMLLSEGEEIQLGRQTDAQIVEDYGTYQDQTLITYMDGVGRKMARLSHRPDLPYQFKILDTPAVNAFAVPGGYVYLTRGILANLNSEAELAGVMGHEIGHITARHSAQQYSKAQLAQITLGSAMILSETFRGFAGLAQLGVGMLFLSFSRDDEREADDLGVEYSSKAGYDATHMALFFETLERMQPKSDRSGLPEWFSTHPNPDDRIGAVQRRAKEWQKELGIKDLKVNRDLYLKHLDGLVYGENPQEGFVEDNMFFHPLLRFQFPVPVNWTLQNTRTLIRITSSKKDAAILFALSPIDSPKKAAQTFVNESSAMVVSSERRNVNGLPAFRLVTKVRTSRGVLGIMSYFIQEGTRVYEFYGLAPERRFKGYSQVFQNTMERFKRLTDRRKLNVKPDRILVVRSPKAGTMEQVLRSLGAPEEKLNQWAIMNGKTLSEPVPSGMLLKIVKRGGE
ncbi:MAG: M48 family metalloprotease [Desulfobacteraceae bacterium]|nr:M48 family metalloprotease [Desulfobacteraceae bacterium]